MSGVPTSPAEDTTSFSAIKFVFLDRDGVINRKAPDGEYVTSWQDIQILSGAERAIALLNRAGRKVIVVTNQRGIALGRYSESDLFSIHEKLHAHLGSFGAHLDAIYYCPHDHGQCTCRKPEIGMFEKAFRDFPEARPQNSVMIGDSNSDIVAGASAGMKTILITDKPSTGGALAAQPSASGRSLLEVVETYMAC
jgi:D-glycero-D-manno-heptose 1,7-bisphosphate phosphatase